MRRFLVGAVLVAAIVVSQGMAATLHVSGFYEVTDPGTTVCTPLGGEDMRLRCATDGRGATFSGSLTGTSSSGYVAVVDCRAGRLSGHGSETFSGSVAGVGSGSLTLRTRVTAAYDCQTEELSAVVARGVVVVATGDLRSLRAALDIDGATYSGDLR